MFCSSLLPVVCRRVHAWFTLFVFVCVQLCHSMYCVVFLFCLSSSCTLCCQFLWIVHFWLKSKNDADEAVSVVSVTSSSGGYINGRNSANLELLIHKTSSIYLYVKLNNRGSKLYRKLIKKKKTSIDTYAWSSI